jgi:hypothetical protein
MTLIDHQILIPASQSKVWATLSDLQQNPLWQANCKAVSVLTTMKSGPGTRWRSTIKSGREQVIEITAWYDRLGYEYRIVDGSSLQNNKGLFRLQEIPEGTIVQWTFSYEPSGFLSGLQDSLRTRRQVETEIIDSLRQLYRLNSSRQSTQAANFEAKSLVKDAPDVEARAHYQPRYPSNIEEAAAASKRPASTSYSVSRNLDQGSTTVGQPLNEISETEFAEGDTRPNPAVVLPAEAAPPPDTDAPYRPPAAVQVSEPENTQPKEASTSDSDTPSGSAEPISEPERETSETQSVTQEAPSVAGPSPEPEIEAPVTVSTSIPEKPAMEWLESEYSSQLDTRELDTAKISVFELFGIPKPSDSEPLQRYDPPQITESTDMIKTVTADPEQEQVGEEQAEVATLPNMPTAALPQTVALDSDFIAALHSEPVGLRWLLRRKTVNVRRPTATR